MGAVVTREGRPPLRQPPDARTSSRLGRRGRRRAAGGRAGIAPGVPGSTGNHPLDREETTPRRALALERRGETIGTALGDDDGTRGRAPMGLDNQFAHPRQRHSRWRAGGERSEPRQVQPPRGARSRRTPSRGRRRTRGTRATRSDARLDSPRGVISSRTSPARRRAIVVRVRNSPGDRTSARRRDRIFRAFRTEPPRLVLPLEL